MHINVDKDPNNAYVSIALTILAEEDKNEEGHAVSIPVFGRIDADDWPRDGGRLTAAVMDGSAVTAIELISGSLRGAHVLPETGFHPDAEVIGRVEEWIGDFSNAPWLERLGAKIAGVAKTSTLRICIFRIIANRTVYRASADPDCFGDIIPVGDVQFEDSESLIRPGQHVHVILDQPIPANVFVQ